MSNLKLTRADELEAAIKSKTLELNNAQAKLEKRKWDLALHRQVEDLADEVAGFQRQLMELDISQGLK